MSNESDGSFIKCSKEGAKLNEHQRDMIPYPPVCGYESINLFLFFVSVLHGKSGRGSREKLENEDL
jgi:hypothetical protein